MKACKPQKTNCGGMQAAAMPDVQREEWRKFSKLAAEGRAFLIELHCPFSLPGEPNAREVMFYGGLELIQRWAHELTEGEFEEQREKVAAERREATMVFRTLLELVKGNLSADSAVRNLSEAGKVGKDWSRFAEPMAARLKAEPDMRDLLQALFQFGELRFAAIGRQLAAADQIVDALTLLGEAAIERGEEFAAERLIELAKYAGLLVEALAEKHPDLVRKQARKSVQWPVLAGVEPDWQAMVQKHLREGLELGEETLHGRFDKTKAYSLENVSRRYARGIVETLEKNRCCAALFKHQMEIIKAKEKRDGFKILVRTIPAWVMEAVALEPFSRETAESWLDVGIKMLKQQRPHLPQQADWKRIRRHWENKGEHKTPGRLWNSIKDALRSPIKTIARAHKAEPLTQKSSTNLGNPNPDNDKV